MSQITSGLRRILSSPVFYSAFQLLVGARSSKTKLVNEHIRIAEGQRILDIGCGTGTLLDFLPSSVEYFGFDESKEYIEYAKKKHGSRGIFLQQTVGESIYQKFDSFDRVVAIGVLHHLNDEEVVDLCTVAKNALREKSGEFHTIDPCYVNGQSKVSKFLVGKDRGQNVRTPSEYESLAKRVFSEVQVANRNDMLRIPYDHAILRCS